MVTTGSYERTYAMIKPGYTPIWGLIITRIIDSGLDLEDIKIFKMDSNFSRVFYAEHVEKNFYPVLENYITSDRVVGMILGGEGAISKWRAIIGPTNPERAKETHPDSLRAMYGRNGTENVCHGSDSKESAEREIKLVFSADDKNGSRESEL